MTVLSRFDKWVATGPFTATDAARYRVVFASVLLLSLPDFQWTSNYPDSFIDPPPGPFSLLTSFPPREIGVGLEIALATGAAFMLFGFFTRLASVFSAVIWIVGQGISYSMGKIDHDILALLVPLVLALGVWSPAVRLGSPRRAGLHGIPQWPFRLLALLIGLAMLTAAAPKVMGGWLNVSTHAVQGMVFAEYFSHGRQDLLASFFIGLDSPLFWEVMDWLVVGVECAVIVCVLNWRAFRLALICLCIFHFGIFLIMNIVFSPNVLAYGAFLPWGRLKANFLDLRMQRTWWTVLLAGAVGFGAWWLSHQLVQLSDVTGQAVVALGAVAAFSALLTCAKKKKIVSHQNAHPSPVP